MAAAAAVAAVAAVVGLPGGTAAAEWLASLGAAVELKQHCSPCTDCTQHSAAAAAADGVAVPLVAVAGVAVPTAEWLAGPPGQRQRTPYAAGRPNKRPQA